MILGGLAYTFLSGGHVRVDLITTHLPPALRAWLRAAGLALGIAFILIVSWTTLQSALTAYRYGRVSTVMLYPLWVPMLLIPAGLLLMSAVMLGALRRQCRAALGPRAGRDEVPRRGAAVTDSLLGSLLIGLMFLLLALGLEVSIALGLSSVCSGCSTSRASRWAWASSGPSPGPTPPASRSSRCRSSCS